MNEDVKLDVEGSEDSNPAVLPTVEEVSETEDEDKKEDEKVAF